MSSTSKLIEPKDLAGAISRELTLYSKEVTENVNDCGQDAIKRLVAITKTTAPTGKRGKFKRAITFTEQKAGNGAKLFIWHVKAPEHRLAHLLVNGHATKDGGRTKANPFLADALAQVLPDYEKEVEEACK